MRRAYAHAIDAGYRFYSFGNPCLLFRSNAGFRLEKGSFGLGRSEHGTVRRALSPQR